jgi:hypothetical protein
MPVSDPRLFCKTHICLRSSAFGTPWMQHLRNRYLCNIRKHASASLHTVIIKRYKTKDENHMVRIIEPYNKAMVSSDEDWHVCATCWLSWTSWRSFEYSIGVSEYSHESIFGCTTPPAFWNWSCNVYVTTSSLQKFKFRLNAASVLKSPGISRI